MCALVSMSLCLPSCSSKPALEVSCDDLYARQHIEETIAVAAGEPFTVVLCSNPSTGFAWGEALISDPSVLAEVGHEYDAREGKRPPAPGSPGAEVWTFRALEPGQSTVSIEYGQPWAEGHKAEWTLVLTVVVE
jgi:predicted secreted protein